MPDIETLYTQYYSKVMGYIHARIRNTADAEDLCADVFEKVQRKLPDFDPVLSLMNAVALFAHHPFSLFLLPLFHLR